jgi:FkbM family methyltransferase
MRKFLRLLFRQLGKLYKREYGKYTILTKLFYPYAATKINEKDIIKVANRFRMALDTSEYIQSHLYLFNSFEPSTIKCIGKLVKPDDIIIDIGANIGYLSLNFAAHLDSSGIVYSFEPERKNYNSLIENISLNKGLNIKPIKKALSNFDGKIKLYISKDNNQGSHSTIYNDQILSENYEEIEALKLDDFIKNERLLKIDFVKIDVEGAEVEVLEGMSSTMQNFKPIILIEMNNTIQNLRGVSTREIKEKLFNEFGYASYNILDNGRLQYSDFDYKHNIDNIVLIHKSKISSLDIENL